MTHLTDAIEAHCTGRRVAAIGPFHITDSLAEPVFGSDLTEYLIELRAGTRVYAKHPRELPEIKLRAARAMAHYIYSDLEEPIADLRLALLERNIEAAHQALDRMHRMIRV